MNRRRASERSVFSRSARRSTSRRLSFDRRTETVWATYTISYYAYIMLSSWALDRSTRSRSLGGHWRVMKKQVAHPATEHVISAALYIHLLLARNLTLDNPP